MINKEAREIYAKAFQNEMNKIAEVNRWDQIRRDIGGGAGMGGIMGVLLGLGMTPFLTSLPGGPRFLKGPLTLKNYLKSTAVLSSMLGGAGAAAGGALSGVTGAIRGYK